MKFFLLSLVMLTGRLHCGAQRAEDPVRATVNSLFTAMKNADAVLLASCFADSAVLQTVVKNKEGKTVIENEAVHEFVSFVSHETKGNADERITIETIKVNGLLAVVWAPYRFYYKGVFSHCGVDSFQLIEINGQWKIQYLIDTRQKTGCE